MNIETLSNGLGGQSMLLLKLACHKIIPATVSITSDTGSENDRVMMDGTRISAQDFFEKHVKPLADKHGIAAFFVRSKYKDGSDFLPLHEQMKIDGRKRQNVPMFGSEGGRLRQTCTDKWKMRAIRQQLRRMGAKATRNAVGLHLDEYTRRKSGVYLGRFEHAASGNKYAEYQTVDGRKEPKPILWMRRYYPLVDLRLNREAVRKENDRLGVPYLVSSECDHCPHQDDARWLAHTPESLEETAKLEDLYEGDFFFTDRRIPLRVALEDMRRNPKNGDPSFGCKNGLCGI